MSTRQWFLSEVKEIGLVTLYFLICFLVFLTLKKLYLEQYQVEITIFGSALIGALVVAKVVILLEKTSFATRFADASGAANLLWRTSCYTVTVFGVSLAEHLFDLYRERGAFAASLDELWAGRDLHHFLALNLVVGVSFLGYNSATIIDRQIGDGGLRRLFFSRPRETRES